MKDIEKYLIRGKKMITITDITEKDDYYIHQKICSDLKDMCNDQTVTKKLFNPENIQKIKQRFQTMIDFNDENGTRLAQTQVFKQDPYQLKNILRTDANVIGQEVNEDTQKMKYDSNFVKLLKLGNIPTAQLKVLGTGKIASINATFVYRKG